MFDDLMKCNCCGLFFNMADLAQVIAHEHIKKGIVKVEGGERG